MARPAIWNDIRDKLEKDIARGLYAPGDKLPTEAELSARFGVNRHTVRRSLAAMADQGIITSKRGAGVFVTQQPTRYALGKRVRFHQNLAAEGRVPGKEIRSIETRRASPDETRHLRIGAGTLVHVCEGLSTADGQPLAWFRTVFPEPPLPGLPDALRQQGSITRALAQCGIDDYTRSWTRLTAETASSALAGQLLLPPGAALLRSESVSVTAAAVPIEYGRTWFAGPRVVLEVASGD